MIELLRALLPLARRADRARSSSSAGPEATVVLASDHGFGPTRDVFHVNSWLEQEGYLRWADAEDGRGAARTTDVGFAEMTRHVHALDWSRTVAYAATPSSQGINIVERVPGGDEPLPEDVRAKLTVEIAAGPARGAPPARRRGRWSRRCGPASRRSRARSSSSARTSRWCWPTAARCRSCPRETIVRPPRAAARPPPLGGHLHRRGPGHPRRRARRGAVDRRRRAAAAPPARPAVPEDMAGSVPERVFEPGELRAPPAAQRARAAARGGVEAPATDVELEPEEQAAVMERLRALGYVE